MKPHLKMKSEFHSVALKWKRDVSIATVLGRRHGGSVAGLQRTGTPHPLPEGGSGWGDTASPHSHPLSQPGFQAGVFKCLLCCDSNDERPKNGTNKDELYFRIKKPMKAADAVIGINCINSDQMGSEKSERSCSLFPVSRENVWVHEFSQNQAG